MGEEEPIFKEDTVFAPQRDLRNSGLSVYQAVSGIKLFATCKNRSAAFSSKCVGGECCLLVVLQ